MDDFYDQVRFWRQVAFPLSVLLFVLLVALPWSILALRRKRLHLRYFIWAALILLAGLIYRYARQGRPGRPERAAWKFLDAITEFDCDTAWRYFSSDSQRAIQRESEQYKSRLADTMRYLPPKVQAQQNRNTQPQNF